METGTPLVSVVVPVHDAGAYLEPCLRSVLEQTMDRFELLCVDDGSTDGSARILQLMARQDARVRVLQSGGRGASAARNVGLREACGRFVQFADADDRILPTMLERQLEAARRLDADMTICGFAEWYAERDQVYAREQCPQRDLYGRAFSLADARVPSLDVLTPNVWRILFRRSFLQSTGVEFHEDLRTAEDLAFIYENLFLCRRVALVDECLYWYRRDTRGSLTHADRGTDGLQALAHVGAFAWERGLLGGPMLRHFVNLVLDTADYGMRYAASLDEMRAIYARFQEDWMEFVERNATLVEPRCAEAYQRFAARDADACFFGLYRQMRDWFEGFRAGEREALLERDEAVAQRDAALDEAQALRGSTSFRVGNALVRGPSAVARRVRGWSASRGSAALDAEDAADAGEGDEDGEGR